MSSESVLRSAVEDSVVGRTVVAAVRAGAGVVEETGTDGRFECSSSANHRLRHLLNCAHSLRV
jgi:hypothetical protein